MWIPTISIVLLLNFQVLEVADYREMISSEADRADAIVIAVADHNHTPLPSGRQRRLALLLRKASVYLSMSILLRSKKQRSYADETQITDNYRRVVGGQSGAIGDVKEVHGSVKAGAVANAEGGPTNLDWNLG